MCRSTIYVRSLNSCTQKWLSVYYIIYSDIRRVLNVGQGLYVCLYVCVGVRAGVCVGVMGLVIGF